MQIPQKAAETGGTAQLSVPENPGYSQRTMSRSFSQVRTYETLLDTPTLILLQEQAKAIYTYNASNSDELSFNEGDTLSIIDTSEEEWWKTEQGGVVLIVPAAYLELVEGQ